MKCTRCAQVISAPCFVISRTWHDGRISTVNLCLVCADQLLGPGCRRRLDLVVYEDGWREKPVPRVRPLLG